MKQLYGLVGRKLGHSFSPRYFAEKFRNEGIDAEFRNFELPTIGELPKMLADNHNLRGFNVTIPYKEEIMPLLDDIAPEARRIGAVNCVKIDNGKLTGYNTDIYGFRKSLLNLIGDERPDALVFGTGGAAKAVWYVLDELGISFRKVSRSRANGDLTYDDLAAEPNTVTISKLLVNSTPLGTFPDVDASPDIPYSAITPAHFMFDLVYNPEQTLFMKKGQAQGAHTSNGYEMLIGQAEKGWEIWTRD